MEPALDYNLLAPFTAGARLVEPPRRTLPSLTGTWACDDGGHYFIRQIGPDVLWYGEADPHRPLFANVAHGTIDDHGCLRMMWADVPKGAAGACGALVLRVTADRMEATRSSGGFGGTCWWR